MNAEVAQDTSAAGRGVEHPPAAILHVSLRRAVDQAEVGMGERAETTGLSERAGRAGQRPDPVGERDGDEGALALRRFGQRSQRGAGDADRLLDQHWQSFGDKAFRQSHHLGRAPHDHRQFRPQRQRLVNGSDGRAVMRRREFGRTFGRRIPGCDDLGTGDSCRCGVHPGMPVADAEKGELHLLLRENALTMVVAA